MSGTSQVIARSEPRKFDTYYETTSLAFFPDGKQAVQVSKCELATLLRMQDGCKVGSLKMPACVATVSKDGKWIVCGCKDGKVRILDAESKTPAPKEMDGRHGHPVSALDVSADSSTIASAAALNGSIFVWSIATRRRLAAPFNLDHRNGGRSRITSIHFSPCGTRLAASACATGSFPLHQSGVVVVLNIRENQLTQHVVVPFNSSLTAISWSDDLQNGRQRILAGLDESLAVIDLHGESSDSRKPICGFRVLSGNGRFIVSSTPQDGVRFWDAITFSEIGPGRNLPSCHPIAISPDNGLVTISSRADRCLSVWNLSDILPKYYTNSNDEPSASSSMAGSPMHSNSPVLGSEGNEAIADFTAVLAGIQRSTNPEYHRQDQPYASLRDSQRKDAETIIFDVVRQRPPVLIDTRTGYLCHGRLRIITLEMDPAYKDLLVFIGAGELGRFRRGVEDFFEYVMFSHKWDETWEEPSFEEVLGKSVYNDLKPSPTHDKLRNFCQAVCGTGHRWAWSDTCCIERTNSAILNEAIVSMYRWYKESALTIALLVNVLSPSKCGDLRDSVWMTRAWTLQELLAPRAIRFYDSEWKLYLNDPNHDHRRSPVINAELASAVSIRSETLSAFRPDNLGVREKLRLASARVAKIEEDVAYSLFGIFASDLQPKYGERNVALGRLLQEIVHRSGDVMVLSWTGKSSRFNSCLPDVIAVYQGPPPTVLSMSSDSNRLKTRVVELRSLFRQEVAMDIYWRITSLPKATFVNRRLHLPCIVFAVHKLTLTVNNTQRQVYRASVSTLGNVSIKTADLLPVQEPHKLFLVHPWISDLRGLPDSLSPSDDHTRALWMIARLGLKFNALLLQQQPYNSGYKRVAADHEICVGVQLPTGRITSPLAIDTRVLDVWDPHTGLP